MGIAPTKTLCKVANYFAKREPERGGTVVLASPGEIDAVLSEFPVGELWGIGRRYMGLLARHEIKTAKQFAALPDDWINKNLTVNGLRDGVRVARYAL